MRIALEIQICLMILLTIENNPSEARSTVEVGFLLYSFIFFSPVISYLIHKKFILVFTKDLHKMM